MYHIRLDHGHRFLLVRLDIVPFDSLDQSYPRWDFSRLLGAWHVRQLVSSRLSLVDFQLKI